MGPLEEKREEKGDQDGQKRGKETRQEGREDVAHERQWCGSTYSRPELELAGQTSGFSRK